MPVYARREKFDQEMTTVDSDKRSASWEEFCSMLEEIIRDSYDLEIKIMTDCHECLECGEQDAKITVRKLEEDDQALHIKSKCLECGAVEDYYAYIA